MHEISPKMYLKIEYMALINLCDREGGLINLTLSAQLNLLRPGPMYLTLAKCPIYKPTEMLYPQLPYNTIYSPLLRAVTHFPAGLNCSTRRVS
jgi:hypothetical protein